MYEWMDDKDRFKREIKEAVENAGGDYGIFDLAEIAEFLLACQNNGIDVWRAYDHENPLKHRKLHVSHNPPIA